MTKAGGIKTALGTFYLANAGAHRGKKVTLLLRPESASLAEAREPDITSGIIAGRVAGRLFVGQGFRVRVAVGCNLELTFDLPNLQPPPPLGGEIVLQINAEMMTVIP